MYNKITSLFLIAGALVPSAGWPQPLSAQRRAEVVAQMRTKLKSACETPVARTLAVCAASEQDEKINCLNSRNLPDRAFRTLRNAALEDCAEFLLEKLVPQLDSDSNELNTNLAFNEMEGLFLKRYETMYHRYCADKNPSVLAPPMRRCVNPPNQYSALE